MNNYHDFLTYWLADLLNNWTPNFTLKCPFPSFSRPSPPGIGRELLFINGNTLSVSTVLLHIRSATCYFFDASSVTTPIHVRLTAGKIMACPGNIIVYLLCSPAQAFCGPEARLGNCSSIKGIKLIPLIDKRLPNLASCTQKAWARLHSK